MKLTTLKLFFLLTVLFVYATRPTINQINLARIIESQWIPKPPKYYQGHKKETTTKEKEYDFTVIPENDDQKTGTRRQDYEIVDISENDLF